MIREGENRFALRDKRICAVRFVAIVLFVIRPTFSSGSQESVSPDSVLTPILAPPAELQIDSYYSKYISANGYPIIASANVDDYALREAAFLVNLMLAERPDVRQAMIESGSRLCVLGYNEYTTDQPEWKWMGDAKADGRMAKGVSAKNYWDARARGMGGSKSDPYCSCAEENLLAYADDPYSTECILIHEFAHNIHLRGIDRVDPTFDRRLQKTYQNAMKAGLWKGKYASVNHHEYFAEGVQSWFGNNRENDHDHNHVNTREELKEYDPELASFCEDVFRETKLAYTKPNTRLTGHLAGYDPVRAPRFVWPERLKEAQAEIQSAAKARSKTGGDDKE